MRTIHRRWLLGCAAALVSVSAAATPTAHAHTSPPTPLRLSLPAPTGPYLVGTTELHLIDRGRDDPWVTGRSREIMITMWYPARPGHDNPLAHYLPPLAAQRFGERTNAILGLSSGQVDWTGMTTHGRIGAPALGRQGRPVVLYSPGARELRAGGTTMVEELASQGYVVVTIDHTYETPEVQFPGGRLETQRLPGIDPTELLRKQIEVRVADTRFVLDQITILAAGGNPDAGQRKLPAGLGRVIDMSRVGMFGHSGGGFTAAETMLDDRRIDAGADMDGSMAYSFANNEFGDVVTQGLDRPFLLLGAGLSDGQPHNHLAAPDWRSFWEHSTGWKLDLYVPEGEHFTFADHQSLLPQLDAAFTLPAGLVHASIGTVDPRRVVCSVRAYLTAYFDEHLRGRPQRLLNGPSPRHPDITFVR